MCMQDWRVGRLVRSSVISRGNTSVTVNRNSQRVGLIVSYQDPVDPVNITAIQIGDNDLNVTALMIPPVNTPYMMTLVSHADIVQHALTVQDAIGNFLITVIEFTMPEDYLSAALEQFKSEHARWLESNYRPMT